MGIGKRIKKETSQVCPVKSEKGKFTSQLNHKSPGKLDKKGK